ncbi:hypothetical protein MFC_00776 [Mesomycoplasma flocculare ATCC 27716]|nr:hypothetical protein MFC_00776 [Mesomycoplasma flocculare ATCC 27716]
MWFLDICLIFSKIINSFSLSRDAVGSSNKINSDPRFKERRIEIRCFSPPDKFSILVLKILSSKFRKFAFFLNSSCLKLRPKILVPIRTLSTAEILSIKLKSWKTISTLGFFICFWFSSKKEIWPLSAWVIFAMMCKSVVFPTPDCPEINVSLLAGISTLILSRIIFEPSFLVTLRIWIIFSLKTLSFYN